MGNQEKLDGDIKLRKLEARVSQLENSVACLNYDDVLSHKIFASAKERFSNWMCWTLFGLLITQLATGVMIIRPLVLELSEKSEKLELKEEVREEVEQKIESIKE